MATGGPRAGPGPLDPLGQAPGGRGEAPWAVYCILFSALGSLLESIGLPIGVYWVLLALYWALLDSFGWYFKPQRFKLVNIFA